MRVAPEAGKFSLGPLVESASCRLCFEGTVLALLMEAIDNTAESDNNKKEDPWRTYIDAQHEPVEIRM